MLTDVRSFTPFRIRARGLAALLAALTAAACARSDAPADEPQDAHGGHAAAGHDMGIEVTVPPGALYTVADVHFMQGMIAHHAQAIHMSNLAEARSVNPRLLLFARKIDQSQRAEIAQMQDWLRAHNQFAPDTSSHRTMTMPGMLTPAQLAELETLRGAAFERRFLELMILHHEGALQMVKDLFAAPLAAQDVNVSALANDIEVVQTAEIAAMYQMLDNL